LRATWGPFLKPWHAFGRHGDRRGNRRFGSLTPAEPDHVHHYRPRRGYDEYFAGANESRDTLKPLLPSLIHMGLDRLIDNHAAASKLLRRLGATFRLNNSDERGGERILPFDPLPRLIGQREWKRLEEGLLQRLEAIDRFLGDIYGPQKILNDGVIPRQEVESSQGWRPAMLGFSPPLGAWCHISGLDLVRDGQGTWRVLEDNLRCPLGVAYFLENWRAMKRIFPSLFEGWGVQPIDDYPSHLLQTLQELCDWSDTPRVVVLTPGVFNSAYFEHSYLAQQMGVSLVKGRDLFCMDSQVWMRSTDGPVGVDVIYRRIDDDFIGPQVFRSDSLLGIPGIMDVYARGRVAIANAPGTGVANDKLIYTFVPRINSLLLGRGANLKKRAHLPLQSGN